VTSEKNTKAVSVGRKENKDKKIALEVQKKF
jgi:hypothetical protein